MIFINFNFSSNDRILDRSKLKAFADDNFNFVPMMDFFFFFYGKENLGNGENSGHQRFLLFPLSFQKLGPLKLWIV